MTALKVFYNIVLSDSELTPTAFYKTDEMIKKPGGIYHFFWGGGFLQNGYYNRKIRSSQLQPICLNHILLLFYPVLNFKSENY